MTLFLFTQYILFSVRHVPTFFGLYKLNYVVCKLRYDDDQSQGTILKIKKLAGLDPSAKFKTNISVHKLFTIFED